MRRLAWQLRPAAYCIEDVDMNFRSVDTVCALHAFTRYNTMSAPCYMLHTYMCTAWQPYALLV